MMLLTCSASSPNVNLTEQDIRWFLVPESALDSLNVTNCTVVEVGSGSGGTTGEGSVLEDPFIDTLFMMEVVKIGSMFIADTNNSQRGGFIVCALNRTNFGRCSSNYTVITGKCRAVMAGGSSEEHRKHT